MKERHLKRNLLYALGVLVTAGMILLLDGPFLKSKPVYEIVALPDDWTLHYQDQLLEDVNLADTNIGLSRKGDVFEVYRPLPDTEVPGACIKVSTVLCALDAYVDDVLIYSFGHDRGVAGRMIPTRLHFIPLPQNYAGKDLHLALTVYRDDSFSGFSPVSVGNRKDLQHQLFQEFRMPLFSGLFLIIFAFVLLVMSVYLVVYQTNSIRIYCSAVLLLLLGAYILSFYDLIDLLSDRPELRTLLEYGALYLIPSATTAFAATVLDGRARRLLTIVSALDAVLAVGTFLLHAMGVIFIYDLLDVFQVLIMLECIPLFGFLIYRLFSDRNTSRRKSDSHIRVSERVLVSGILFLFVGTILDMLRYIYVKYFSLYGSAYSDITSLTLGAMIFAACLIINYFYYSIDFINAQMTRERMRGLAYTDSLTGLANRTRCEEIMQRFNGETEPFIIISLDVNNLKEVNDTQGHGKGDELITGFAQMLIACFEKDAYLIGRMGGDEFIAIFKGSTYARVQGLLDDLSARMRKENTGGRTYRIDAAWGVANSDEVAGAVARDVYMLADSRMYANKNARKRARELSRKLSGGRQLHG